MKYNHKWGSTSRTKRAQIHEILQQFADDLLILSPYDISITQGERTDEYQLSLYEKGRAPIKGTNPVQYQVVDKAKVVTNADGRTPNTKSFHQKWKVLVNGKVQEIALAFDIGVIHPTTKKITYEKKHEWMYEVVGNIGNTLSELKYGGKITWGGTFTSLIDLPHFEYKIDETDGWKKEYNPATKKSRWVWIGDE